MKVNVTMIRKTTKKFVCPTCGREIIVQKIERTPLRHKKSSHAQ